MFEKASSANHVSDPDISAPLEKEVQKQDLPYTSRNAAGREDDIAHPGEKITSLVKFLYEALRPHTRILKYYRMISMENQTANVHPKKLALRRITYAMSPELLELHLSVLALLRLLYISLKTTCEAVVQYSAK